MQLSLKAARVNAGYSQSAMADLLGVSKSTVSRWENDMLPVPEHLMAQICQICSIEKESLTCTCKPVQTGENKEGEFLL